MIEKIIAFSVKNKLIIGLFTLALVIGGIAAMTKLPVDAVPDITNNQVQIVTSSSSLAPQEVEQFITFPIEMAMANIPQVSEIRSISRFGLSVVTVVFEDDVPTLNARQFVKEQIDIAKQEIPSEMGSPEMMPITTGLGEIYQYTLQVDSNYQKNYDIMELRTIQDWIVKRQLAGTEGIIEVSSFGGYLKQYEVSIDPIRLQSSGVTLTQVFNALGNNNQNSGGSYIEKSSHAYYIRTEGLVNTKEDIENIVVTQLNGTPVLVKQIGEVKFGHPPRFGAMTKDGKGEVVGGITLMLKGANSSEAIENVHMRIAEIQKSLPKGVHIEPYLDRSVLVGKAISTVTKNLIEGGLIVIFVLLLLLGNFRAGLIVASVIPLSLLFAFIMMYLFDVSANLMSLGAIDFGIVVDGAVIIVESVLHFLYISYIGKSLSRREMDDAIVKTSSKIIGSAAFGVLIIIVVFVPIMTLTGIEGKTFMPMAQTVSFAILGALILSVSYVPMMSALILKRDIREHKTFADRIVAGMIKAYKPVLIKAVNYPKTIILIAVAILSLTVFFFSRMGGEFIPTLNEGDLAMQATIEPGSSLTKMIETTTKAEGILKAEFPEVKHVVSKIGTAEVPTDPMAVEDADIMILLKEPEEWTSASTREELVEKMKKSLEQVKDAQFDFTQPIQLRFNELISGAKTDVVIKLFGDDLKTLSTLGEQIKKIAEKVDGAGDVKLEQTEGLPQLMVRFNREKLALHGVSIDDANRIVRSAFAGENAGIVYEGERRFDLTLRLDENFRNNLNLEQLFISNANNKLIPLSEIAEVTLEDGPMQVSRENARRRIAVGVNIRNRDIASFIKEVETKLSKGIKLPPGYYIKYGGQFENLEAAKARLSIVVPAALILIFLLLFFAFKSIKYAILIYMTVPLSAAGGVFALLLRDMPFSISAGVGFIALFGVAVLNGIVLISHFNHIKMKENEDMTDLVIQGAISRLRPVMMTAAVASFGFLPMAISTSAGAEVQKPLATVVIGGLITATLLTLVVLPSMYALLEKRTKKKNNNMVLPAILLFMLIPVANGQQLSLDQAIDSMKSNNPLIRSAELEIQKSRTDKRAAFSFGETSASYQFGQINSDLTDRFVQVDQSIGNPLAMARKRQLSGELITINEIELSRYTEELSWKTRNAWYNWMSSEQKTSLIEDQLHRFDEYLKKVKERADQGDVSEMDLYLAEIYRSELSQSLLQLKNQSNSFKQQLKVIASIKGDFTPDTNFRIKPVLDQIQRPDSATIYHEALVAQNKYAEANWKLERSMIAPNISAGYFNQTLDHVRGFQGGIVAVTLPIFDSKYYNSVKKAKLVMEQQALETTYNLTVYDSKINELGTRLDQQSDLLSVFEAENLSKIDFLQKAIETEFSSGEIDYYKYLQVYRTILDFQLRHLDLINDYNQTYFELMYLQASK